MVEAMKDFDSLNRDELRALCKSLGQVGYGKLGSGQLRGYLRDLQRTQPAKFMNLPEGPTLKSLPERKPGEPLATMREYTQDPHRDRMGSIIPLRPLELCTLVEVVIPNPPQAVSEPAPESTKPSFNFRTGNAVPATRAPFVREPENAKYWSGSTARAPLAVITETRRINQLIEKYNREGAEKAKINPLPTPVEVSERALQRDLEKSTKKERLTNYALPIKKKLVALEAAEETATQLPDPGLLMNVFAGDSDEDFDDVLDVAAPVELAPVVPMPIVKDVQSILQDAYEDHATNTRQATVVRFKPSVVQFPEPKDFPAQESVVIKETPCAAEPAEFVRGALVRDKRSSEVGVVVWMHGTQAYVCWMGWKHPGDREPSLYTKTGFACTVNTLEVITEEQWRTGGK